MIFGTSIFSNTSVIILRLFSCSEAVSRDIVVAVLFSYTSPPPSFCGDRFSTCSPLFVLSLLLDLFVLISLFSWPFEARKASSFSLLFSLLLLNLLLSFVSIRSGIFSFRESYTTVFIPIDTGFIVSLTRA